ncbi:MAG: hypothetical protein ACRDA7_01385 [Metamycoplasmataceae bacterium]
MNENDLINLLENNNIININQKITNIEEKLLILKQDEQTQLNIKYLLIYNLLIEKLFLFSLLNDFSNTILNLNLEDIKNNGYKFFNDGNMILNLLVLNLIDIEDYLKILEFKHKRNNNSIAHPFSKETRKEDLEELIWYFENYKIIKNNNNNFFDFKSKKKFLDLFFREINFKNLNNKEEKALISNFISEIDNKNFPLWVFFKKIFFNESGNFTIENSLNKKIIIKIFSNKNNKEKFNILCDSFFANYINQNKNEIFKKKSIILITVINYLNKNKIDNNLIPELIENLTKIVAPNASWSNIIFDLEYKDIWKDIIDFSSKSEYSLINIENFYIMLLSCSNYVPYQIIFFELLVNENNLVYTKLINLLLNNENLFKRRIDWKEEFMGIYWYLDKTWVDILWEINIQIKKH